MKPKITFKDGAKLLVVDSRDFSEPPPINQELDLRDARYRVTSYESVVVNVELVPEEEQEEAPQRNKKAKRVAKKQAKVAAKSKRASRTTGDGKTAQTAIRGKFYNSKSN